MSAGEMRYRVFNFSPKRGFLLSPFSARGILEGRSEVPVNVGLEIARVYLEGDRAKVEGRGIGGYVDLSLVERLAGSDRFVFVHEGGSYFVERREGGRYYKLRYLGERVSPTLEIDGVHMHNIVGVDPWSDALRKISLAKVRRGDRVLDICTGLGYTAIASLKRGASVTTVEVSWDVLWIAEHNPFSWGLAGAKVLLGDAWDVLDELGEVYDRIIHDPPVFSHAGMLYSGDFYKKLYRRLKPGGVLFHYTGAPGRRRGVKFQRGVVERLRRAGFRILRVVEGYGVVARRI